MSKRVGWDAARVTLMPRQQVRESDERYTNVTLEQYVMVGTPRAALRGGRHAATLRTFGVVVPIVI